MRQFLPFSLLAFCFILCGAHAHAQLLPAYGVFGDFNLNMYQADFRSIPTVPSCCPLYQDGSGTGFSVGLLYELPLAAQLRLALRAGYSSRGGTMKRTENTTVAGNIPGVFEHQVDASLADIGLEPLLQYNVFGSMWINVGGRLAYVSTKSFSQKETLISPTSFVFSNGATVRNEFTDQPIPESSALYAAVIGGISYDLPLNSQNTLKLAPEILFSYGLTPVVSGLKWNSNSLRFGLALKYSPKPEPTKRFEKIQKIDTIKKEAPVVASLVVQGNERIMLFTQELGDEIITTETLQRTDTLLVPQKVVPPTPIALKQSVLTVSVAATGVKATGEEIPTVKLEVEEFSSILMTPLLNYIFFDENSSSLPSRYKLLDQQGVESFSEEKVNSSNRLTTYYHILNIVGKRMRQNPTATITLIGCNADFGVEKGNLNLSKQRALAVKDYLMQHWSLSDSRIKIESRNLPEKAALSQTDEGYQENRRVEIIATIPAITFPIITHDTLRRANPPSVRFRSQVFHDNPITQWSLTAEQEGTILKRFAGIGEVPATLDWNIDREEGTHPRSEAGLHYSLNCTDSEAKTAASGYVIPVEQITIHRKRIERRGDKEINRYSLILFEVRSTEINTINKPIISLIKANIAANSMVKIAGYTDRLGDERANQTLAEGRAKTTAVALGITGTASEITSQGNAETYNPVLPEGRLYTRTVDVVIETPIKE